MSSPLLAHKVEISEGLTLADLTTVEACHMALLTLTRDINRIEEQLADSNLGDLADGWPDRAESALRFKRALRQIINERVGDLRRADRAAAAATREHLLVETFKRLWPAEFRQAVEAARTDNSHLWRD